VKTRRTINTVAIEERHRGHAVIRSRADEFFRQPTALEEAECGTGMKFDV
jgi:hypothetical protein